jgi:putative hemolysin
VSIEGAREAVARSGHSRFPVIETDLDHLVGILHVKDLLRIPGDPEEVETSRLLREPHFVPETKPLLELLQELRLQRRAFALVLDEHGGIEGLVTIKDIVSELVGELQDEYDPSVPSLVEYQPGDWIADGRVPIDDLEEALGIQVAAGPYSTIGGLILDITGRIPQEGEAVNAPGIRLVVVRMDRHRIDRVRIETVRED